MKSKTTRKFWRLFDELAPETQEAAPRALGLWRDTPDLPSLQFKRVSRKEPVYSVRTGLSRQAPHMLRGDTVLWFWIGAHDDFDRLLGRGSGA